MCCRRTISALFHHARMPHYAVAAGRKIGIYTTWSECEEQVKGFGGAKFKKFNTENEAIDYMSNHVREYKTTPSSSSSSSSSVRRITSRFGYLKHASRALGSVPDKITEDPFESSPALDAALSKVMDGLDDDSSTKKLPVKRKTQMIDALPLFKSPTDEKRQKMDDGTTCSLDADGFVAVYTDGACSMNGTRKAQAGLGVYFGEGHPWNASEPVSGRATNNCGEIQAATKAIRVAHAHGVTKLAINTDSQFLINSVTKWMPGWKKKGWKLASGEPVKNEIDFKELDSVINLIKIKWIYVKAHCGILGNERADQLAKEGAENFKI